MISKIKKALLLLVILTAWMGLFGGQDEIPVSIERVSERVIILKETLMDNNITAIASQKGLIVVDTSGVLSTAEKIRGMIEKEFGRKDFLYLINTHFHWDHTFGNQAFDDAVIVGYTGNPAGMRRNLDSFPRRMENLARRITEESASLEQMDAASGEAMAKKAEISQLEREKRDLERMTMAYPEVMFNDRLVLDCGDLTLKLYFFGRAHSGADIFIHIPEEGLLLTGDVFLDENWLPLFAGQRVLDIPKWIDVLSVVLDGADPLDRVIPGHKKIWSREKLDLWRDYIVDLWEGINQAKNQGLNIDEVLSRFPLGEEYMYLKNLGHDDARLRQFQEENVRAFWRQLSESTASEVERVLTEKGIEAAVETFQRIKSDPDNVLEENQLNSLGYQLLQDNKLNEAVAVFKMNVEAFPGSWNVYDSLAEAYMNGGNRELAINFYRKSLELNPDNRNAREQIARLEKK